MKYYKIGEEELKDLIENTHIFNTLENYRIDKWFFAHYHVDKQLDDKYTCLLNNFIEL